MTDPNKGTHIVFYDGICRLCDQTVQVLLRIDRDQVLSFAPLQGKTAELLLQRNRMSKDSRTMLFVENYGTDREAISAHSTGILRIFARVGGFWRTVSWLRVVPRPLRDFIYRTVARHRYRWFGRFDNCKLPDADLAERFLD